MDTLWMQLQEYCPDINLIQTCRSGKAGLEAIETLQPDLIFTDTEMPLMNGIRILEKTCFLNVFSMDLIRLIKSPSLPLMDLNYWMFRKLCIARRMIIPVANYRLNCANYPFQLSTTHLCY